MDVVKIVIIGLLFAVIIVYLQSINKELALIATIAAGIILIISILSSLKEIFSLYSQIASNANFGDETIKLIIKITIICYLVEFAVGIIEDFGLKTLADKVSLAGRIIIILTALPIVTTLIKTLASLTI